MSVERLGAKRQEKMDTQDTEITLGTGKLLGIFFGLAIICGVFFTLGYMLGRGSAPGAGATEIVGAVPGGNSANKPAAGNKGGETVTQTCPPGSPNCLAASTGPGSNVYNSVTSKTPDAQLPSASSHPAAEETASSGTPAPEVKPGGSGSFMVQVAAVSKKEDADILVTALQKRQYPVFVVANVPGDSLFHVQVGPFADAKEAESMRSRLAGDGYNAIVKK